MSFAVVWRPSAELQLADLWTTATDRNAVTAAANRIDADLACDPLSAGESRAGNTLLLRASAGHLL
jgi:hypothetical protein